MKKEDVILVGAGGHCKIIIESLDLEQYNIRGILDDNIPVGTCICNIPVIGNDDDAESFFKDGIHYAIITIVGNLKIRRFLLEKYRRIGFQFPTIIHKTSHISNSAKIGEGVTLLANTCINAEAEISDFATINTGAIVEHEVFVGENSHIAPGAILLGASKIGNETMIGAGSTVLQQVYVGNNCTVGAGSVVLKDIEDARISYGNPAKTRERLENNI